MGNFAKIENGIITDIILANQEFINTLPDSEQWIEKTSEIAGIGLNYDSSLLIFYPPQPFPSWILNTDTYLWESPITYPTDGKNYIWDEGNQNWVESTVVV